MSYLYTGFILKNCIFKEFPQLVLFFSISVAVMCKRYIDRIALVNRKADAYNMCFVCVESRFLFSAVEFIGRCFKVKRYRSIVIDIRLDLL